MWHKVSHGNRRGKVRIFSGLFRESNRHFVLLIFVSIISYVSYLLAETIDQSEL